MSDSKKESLADEVEETLRALSPEDYHHVLKIVALRQPWRPKHTGWVNVLDQVLHAIYAIIVFLPVMVWPSYWAAALSGFLLGAIREWEQYKNWDLFILMFWDRLQDATFFAIGATLLYHFIN